MTVWQKIRGQGGRTAYHSCTDHRSGLRLAVSAKDRPNPTRWRWSVYDMTKGSRSGGLLIVEGESGSWAKARVMAGLAADRWRETHDDA